jgi:hypothetical protein
MQLRRKLALFFSVAVCAFALVFRAPAPSLGHAEFAPLPRFDQMASVEPLAENDATMIALRQQASAALAGLQAAAAKRP